MECQRPIFAAADLENQLRANQASDRAGRLGLSRAFSEIAPGLISRMALSEWRLRRQAYDRLFQVSRNA